jgi:hypothetical protein
MNAKMVFAYKFISITNMMTTNSDINERGARSKLQQKGKNRNFIER